MISWLLLLPVDHGVAIKRMMGIRRWPAAEIRTNADESTADQICGQPRAVHLRQLHAGQLRVHRHPISGHISTPEQNNLINTGCILRHLG
jgi:hypothetical protein